MVVKEELGELKEVRPGRTLFVRKVVIGPAGSKPVLNLVAVHGTCATQAQYQPVLEALDEPLTRANISINVWLYDNVGCGQSPTLNEWNAYSNENFSLDLYFILSDFVLEKKEDQQLPCVFLGHSYAPTILLDHLNLYLPVDDLKWGGFIFVGSAVRSPDRPDLLMRDGGHPIMRLPVFLLNCLQAKLSESFLELALCKDCDPALKEQCRKENTGQSMAMAKATHRHHKWATTEDLDVLKALPTLILHGSEDGIISPQNSEIMAKKLPKSKLVYIPKASHLVMLEQPVQMATAIVDFLKQIVP